MIHISENWHHGYQPSEKKILRNPFDNVVPILREHPHAIEHDLAEIFKNFEKRISIAAT